MFMLIPLTNCSRTLFIVGTTNNQCVLNNVYVDTTHGYGYHQ